MHAEIEASAGLHARSQAFCSTNTFSCTLLSRSGNDMQLQGIGSNSACEANLNMSEQE